MLGARRAPGLGGPKHGWAVYAALRRSRRRFSAEGDGYVHPLEQVRFPVQAASMPIRSFGSQPRMSTIADVTHLLASVIQGCQVAERRFQTAVTQPFLNLAGRGPGLVPVGREVFTKPM